MDLQKIIDSNKKGVRKAVTSVCSANEFVIKAAIRFAKVNKQELLIEATSNQVDQFGGYTGMKPKDFVAFVNNLAVTENFPLQNIMFGGDHLGPNVWQNETSDIAMENAKVQIEEYVKAGFRKIHLDTSFKLKDDPQNEPLSLTLITERAATLCKVSEETYIKYGAGTKPPVYIIGSEVPIPGGAKNVEEVLEITTSKNLGLTIELSKEAFYKNGLEDAWNRVIAVVVQPGVEFSENSVHDYNPNLTKELVKKIEDYEGIAFEAHSTDYQKLSGLINLVEDHFGILKVGPWLTYAAREAIIALAEIESEIIPDNKNSKLRNTIKSVMNQNPKYWKNHYNGTQNEIEVAKIFSYSDRIRYYWTDTEVKNSLKQLLNNLTENEIPDTLLSQYLPNQYKLVREGKISKMPEDLIISKISEILEIYNSACGGNLEK